MRNISTRFFFVLLTISGVVLGAESATRAYNGTYTGAHLSRIAFPIGGIGAGMYGLEGTGSLTSMSLRHRMEFFHEPIVFAAVCVLGETPEGNVARVLEGPVPDWKYFGRGGAGLGSVGKTYGLPRFRECSFESRFPFATINLKDKAVPLAVRLVGWSPFTPPDADSSSLPAGALEYTFTNTSDRPHKAIFSFNTRNFMRGNNATIEAFEDGFALFDDPEAENPPASVRGGFAFFVRGGNGEKVDPVVDHTWFRGGWWDPMTMAWNNIERGLPVASPPDDRKAQGATLAVPFALAPGESRTFRLLTAWYVPASTVRYAVRTPSALGNPFNRGPVAGTGTNQLAVEGYLGRKLVNTFNPGGDPATGMLTSPEFKLDRKFIHLLVGGGRNCAVELWVDGQKARTASGDNAEALTWKTWDVSELAGKVARIRIADEQTGDWGHINVDHIVASNETLDTLAVPTPRNGIADDAARVALIADFEGDAFGEGWVVGDAGPAAQPNAIGHDAIDTDDGKSWPGGVRPTSYVPWYAVRFGSLGEVARFWVEGYDDLRRRSQLFADTFYDSTLPPEVLEAVAANLTILKTPTVLRQHDGRLWNWEGCEDGNGSCPGSCTHVWNYAQALCHLFPALERSLRQTEFFEGTTGEGRQAFRAALPLGLPGPTQWDAADGQLGGIMKAYRDWRISGDDAWLQRFWPRIVLSMDFCIRRYDPDRTGLPYNNMHNTYDINYHGFNGHIGTFYLGALHAFIEMGKHTGAPMADYEKLLAAGKKRLVDELYNGEYFVQQVDKERTAGVDPKGQSEGYRALAEQVNREGPKYQYGTGCLSDGVLGLWIAKTAGLDAEVIDPALVRSHLLSVYKYNFRPDLSEHANPQRPTYAMGSEGGLLLCTWPRGGKPLLPFVYSDEVWTGIEYQAASHLMMLGCVKEGLAIVGAVRDRYDGRRRNPFNEYECGHWYGRAQASYGLLQGLTGVRYDRMERTLYVDSRIGDFRSFLSTEGGFGTVVFRDGQAVVEVKSGDIPVDRVVVAGR